MAVQIIAECGCNHGGDIKIAKDMIDIAATLCKVDVVKFQKRCNKELLTDEEYNSPHPVPENSYGDTYGSHREFLEFTIDQHAELKAYCESKSVTYSTSVWDLTSAKEIVELNPEFIKVPSACNVDTELLDYLCGRYSGEIHVSLGMTYDHEVSQIIYRIFESRNRLSSLVLYACTSGYPVPFEDVCLREITKLRKHLRRPRKGKHLRRPRKGIKKIGFSGHHLGIAIDNAAVALGAQAIERHFTLNRTSKGTDHAASLEPQGLQKLVRDIRATEKALTYKKQEILPIEEVQRAKLKRKVER